MNLQDMFGMNMYQNALNRQQQFNDGPFNSQQFAPGQWLQVGSLAQQQNPFAGLVGASSRRMACVYCGNDKPSSAHNKCPSCGARKWEAK